jgi:cell pole-organizing protein PopZ
MAKEKDWKEFLAEADREILAQLLESTKKHKCAFMQAEDVKVAQLWCALVEMRKQMVELEQLVGKVAEPFKAIVEMGEIEKRKTIDRMVREILRPEPDQEEATKKLVDSLMKF